jgi:hypothetical protein
MGFLKSATMVANEALRPIRAGAKQARSYYKPMGSLGLQISREVATHAGGVRGLAIKAGIGATAGAAGGVGYAATDPRATSRSMIRTGLKGAAIGALGGAVFGVGRSAYAMRGSEAMKNLGANARLLGKDMRSAYQSTKSTWGDMSRYYAGVGANASMGATMRGAGSQMRSAGYGAGAGMARRAAGWTGRMANKIGM